MPVFRKVGSGPDGLELIDLGDRLLGPSWGTSIRPTGWSLNAVTTGAEVGWVAGLAAVLVVGWVVVGWVEATPPRGLAGVRGKREELERRRRGCRRRGP